MALWPMRAKEVTEQVKANAVLPDYFQNQDAQTAWAGGWPTGWPSPTSDGPVSRKDALSVPALSRAVDLLATTVATLPVEHVVKSAATGKSEKVQLSSLMEQPERGRPRYNTLIDTAKDLILDGVSYWLTVERSSDGFPRFVKHMPLAEVAFETNNVGEVSRVTFRGHDVPVRDVIAFQGWHDGILNHGQQIIRTAMALEAASRRYADVPLPSLIVKNTSAYELSPGEVSALLNGVKQARQASAVGYINGGVEMDTMGWDAKELQLVEARVFLNASIANLVGIPAHFIAASNVGGSSLTYANASQEARTLIDYGLKPLLGALEARMNMNDVTPRGHTVRFELDAMLRGNPMERSQLYHSLIPLGVLTVEEAREWEDLAPNSSGEAALPEGNQE